MKTVIVSGAASQESPHKGAFVALSCLRQEQASIPHTRQTYRPKVIHFRDFVILVPLFCSLRSDIRGEKKRIITCFFCLEGFSAHSRILACDHYVEDILHHWKNSIVHHNEKLHLWHINHESESRRLHTDGAEATAFSGRIPRSSTASETGLKCLFVILFLSV